MNTRTKAFLWVSLIFILGTAFGGTLTFFWLEPTIITDADSKEKHKHHSTTDESVQRLGGLLDLDSSQQAELRQILEETRQQYRQASREKKRRYQNIRLNARDRIRAILQPAQREKFEQFLQEKDRRRKEEKKDKDC